MLLGVEEEELMKAAGVYDAADADMALTDDDILETLAGAVDDEE